VAQDLIVRMGTEVAVAANALIRRLSLKEEDTSFPKMSELFAKMFCGTGLLSLMKLKPRI